MENIVLTRPYTTDDTPSQSLITPKPRVGSRFPWFFLAVQPAAGFVSPDLTPFHLNCFDRYRRNLDHAFMQDVA